MKRLIILVITATAMSVANATPRTDRLVEAARQAGWTETQIDRLRGLCTDYDRAYQALLEFQELSGLMPKQTAGMRQSISADVRDKAIQQIAKVAKEHRNRFAVISRTIRRYDTARTNMTARAARQSMQAKLDTARTRADQYWTNYTNQINQTQAYSNAVVIAQGIAQDAQAKVSAELTELRAEKTELEAKIADSKYILLRTWLKTKLAAVEARIAAMEALNQ